MAHILKDYIALLDRSGLLAAPIPREIDQTAPVALVSYDSREVVPGTLFLCKGAHFKPEFLEMAQERGALAYVSQVPYPSLACPAFRSMICARPSLLWPTCSTATPPES